MKQRLWRNGPHWLALYGLLSLPLYHPGPPFQGVALPVWAGPSRSIKKLFHTLVYSPSDDSNSSVKGPSSQMSVACAQLTKQNHHTHQAIWAPPCSLYVFEICVPLALFKNLTLKQFSRLRTLTFIVSNVLCKNRRVEKLLASWREWLKFYLTVYLLCFICVCLNVHTVCIVWAQVPKEARTRCEVPWKCHHRQWVVSCLMWHSKPYMLSGGWGDPTGVLCTIWDISVDILVIFLRHLNTCWVLR